MFIIMYICMKDKNDREYTKKNTEARLIRYENLLTNVIVRNRMKKRQRKIQVKLFCPNKNVSRVIPEAQIT